MFTVVVFISEANATDKYQIIKGHPRTIKQPFCSFIKFNRLQ